MTGKAVCLRIYIFTVTSVLSFAKIFACPMYKLNQACWRVLTPEKPLGLPPAVDISSGMNIKISSHPNHSTPDQIITKC